MRNILAKISVSVRVAVRKINRIIVIFRRELESEAVINWAIAIIGRLECRCLLVQNGRRAKSACSAESHTILVAECILCATSLIVSDILAVTVPPLPGFLSIQNRVHKRAHALAVGAVRFHEIDYIEAVSLVLSGVLHTEVIPLRIAVSAIIILQIKFIVKGAHFDRLAKIT